MRCLPHEFNDESSKCINCLEFCKLRPKNFWMLMMRPHWTKMNTQVKCLWVWRTSLKKLHLFSTYPFYPDAGVKWVTKSLGIKHATNSALENSIANFEHFFYDRVLNVISAKFHVLKLTSQWDMTIWSKNMPKIYPFYPGRPYSIILYISIVLSVCYLVSFKREQHFELMLPL